MRSNSADDERARLTSKTHKSALREVSHFCIKVRREASPVWVRGMLRISWFVVELGFIERFALVKGVR
jgi:hypothetical protein